jgi:hypothetical protein
MLGPLTSLHMRHMGGTGTRSSPWVCETVVEITDTVSRAPLQLALIVIHGKIYTFILIRIKADLVEIK